MEAGNRIVAQAMLPYVLAAVKEKSHEASPVAAASQIRPHRGGAIGRGPSGADLDRPLEHLPQRVGALRTDHRIASDYESGHAADAALTGD